MIKCVYRRGRQHVYGANASLWPLEEVETIFNQQQEVIEPEKNAFEKGEPPFQMSSSNYLQPARAYSGRYK